MMPDQQSPSRTQQVGAQGLLLLDTLSAIALFYAIFTHRVWLVGMALTLIVGLVWLKVRIQS